MDQDVVVKNVGFTIDAGLIQRLGYELVGRAETAVSELIKNAYDADATSVEVSFINSSQKGGTLIISDNGVGMTDDQLINGFMRISSTDKIHNPTSKKFKRAKAGRKGIGRFATQRLGETLTIITQTKESNLAIRILIEWNRYNIDTELSSIKFPIDFIEKEKEEGTILIIDKLREGWSLAAINKVYRYVIDLFQPSYLSERSKCYNSAIQNEESFKVDFLQIINDVVTPVVNEQLSFLNKSLAVFEGCVSKDHTALITVKSESLNIDDIIDISFSETVKEFSELEDVYFKMHYFIYSRTQYYDYRVTNFELKAIQDLAKNAGGIRLYRNGFRVLPYGEPTDDWTNIDKRGASESGTNTPLNNKNLFGFVEITDQTGKTFEETASREGLIENDAFRQLSIFINKSILAARQRVSESVARIKNESKSASNNLTDNSEEKQQSTEEKLNALESLIHFNFEDKENEENPDESKNEMNQSNKQKKLEAGKKIVEEIRKELEELSMLRVLAGMGLTIGEFTHEIKQFQPSVYGHISKLKEQQLTSEALEHLKGIEINLDNFIAYTSYFSATVSQNISRQTEPIDILEVLDVFHKTIFNDLLKSDIFFQVDEWDFDVISIPMHKSEWSSILFNLYTNSKKAIVRKKNNGKIIVEVGVEKDVIFINFNDNGDGIPQENRNRIFNAFFTTSTPAGFNAPQNDQMVGTGLGLKIIKDIITSYKGKIYVAEPRDGFSTNIRIELPHNNK